MVVQPLLEKWLIILVLLLMLVADAVDVVVGLIINGVIVSVAVPAVLGIIVAAVDILNIIIAVGSEYIR